MDNLHRSSAARGAESRSIAAERPDRLASLFAIFSLLAFMSAATVFAGLLFPVTAWAQDGKAAGAPQRVVSIDGSITEIIYQLGAQDRLVAVDTTSRFPQAATELPDVGYMRQLSAEGILSMQPDLVITTEAAGPEMVFIQLKQAGIRVVRVANHYSLQGVLDKITAVAGALGKESEGQALVERIHQRSQALLQQMPADDASSVMFLLGAGSRGMMASGSGTQADAMLALVGASNAMGYSGYKPVSAEGALQAAPDVVLVAQLDDEVPESLQQSLAMTPASQQGRIHTVDVSLMLGFGPRLPDAIQQLQTILYPQTNEPVSKSRATGM
ncbi:ABC transporter substrate-binding protein [Oceanobacter sp. 5_MG-2023]|uniref:heme/hemin ABC transporter substrate-binding protein n=1 Tax=Oceanobacter sp. 5_MG-2023 TaxID=3062645 RepID=UPI0026E490FC|nr:ABC transporter substrate-binding protein [Oceanobacter sp. 5_MG-2023]MDO6681208.1 ABC transporter substrate-binding protein [Oceanobacter sp. 5_MG-2023]